MDETLGNIRIVRMIWVQTLGVFGSLLFCYLNSGPHKELPTIVDIAKIYPNSIVFRIGMLYSMFVLFLNNLIIKWAVQEANDVQPHKKRLISTTWLALISIITYALFVSCIDNARINYDWVHTTVAWAGLGFGFLIDLIMWNIGQVRKSDQKFMGSSWAQKKIHCTINVILQAVQFAIYSGQLDISYKVILEWLMVINVVLFFFTFRIDFKKAEMGVEVDEWSTQPMESMQIQQQPYPCIYQQQQYVYV